MNSLWLGLSALAVVANVQLACSERTKQETRQALDVETVALRRHMNENRQDELRLTAVTAVTVHAVWKGHSHLAAGDAAGRVFFPDVFPNARDPVDIYFDFDGVRFAVLDFGEPSLTLPAAYAETDAVAAAELAESLVVARGENRVWTVSGPGQRGELYFSHRHTLGLRVPPEIRSLDDPYATASFFSGSGTIECDGDDVNCTDPGGFASGPSGFTVHMPRGVVEVGFVERITEQATGLFVETGELFYRREYQTGETSSTILETLPRLEPDFDYCGVDGFSQLQVFGIGREFVIGSRGGLRIDLGLRSPGGLWLPIFADVLWPQHLVHSQNEFQSVRWRYPFRLTDELAGFSYEYAMAATTAREDGLGTTYDDGVVVRGIAGDADICRLAIDAPYLPAEFVRPSTAVPMTASSLELLWLGEVAPLRRIDIEDELGTLRLRIWLTRSDRLSVDLTHDAFAGVALEPGQYRLRYWAYPDAALALNDVLVTALAPGRQARYFTQAHRFEVR